VLSEAFLSEISRGLGRAPSGISRDARQHLLEYDWPGNVRELRNALERAAILCDGGLITSVIQLRDRSAGDGARDDRRSPPPRPFNKSKATKALGLTRQQLYVRMRKYGIN